MDVEALANLTVGDFLAGAQIHKDNPYAGIIAYRTKQHILDVQRDPIGYIDGREEITRQELEYEPELDENGNLVLSTGQVLEIRDLTADELEGVYSRAASASNPHIVSIEATRDVFGLRDYKKLGTGEIRYVSEVSGILAFLVRMGALVQAHLSKRQSSLSASSE